MVSFFWAYTCDQLQQKPHLRTLVMLLARSATNRSEEYSSSNEDDKQPLHPETIRVRGRVSRVRG